MFATYKITTMKRFFIVSAFALFAAACTTDNTATTPQPEDNTSKIINSSEDAANDRLLVKLTSYSASFDVECEAVSFSAEPLFPAGKADAETLRTEDIYRWWLLRFDAASDVEMIAREMAADKRVAFVEYDSLMESVAEEQPTESDVEHHAQTRLTDAEMPFNDPELHYQWHYNNDESIDDGNVSVAGADINLFAAWKYTTGDPRVVVAVLDGGVHCEHEDLAPNIWVNEAEKNGTEGIDDDMNGYVDDIHGYNFYDHKGEQEYDETGTMRSHATHVSGTIAAVNNNGYCGCGIAGGTGNGSAGNGDGCRIMACQIFNSGNATTESSIASAIKYAADNGAAIINNSWAYSSGSYVSDQRFNQNYSVLMDALRYFEQNGGCEGVLDGGLMIFAAGNDGKATPSYPGAYFNHICVSAMGPNFLAATYTNYGAGANICAPGGEGSAVGGYGTVHKVSSTTLDPYGYGYNQGTSMAAPHVTGCAALGLSYALKKGYSFSIDEYKKLILSSVHDIDQYQTGTKKPSQGNIIDMTQYVGKLGGGYIDAHLLLMQIEGTPCIYISAGKQESVSLDNYFGGGSERLTYTGVEMSAEEMSKLGISTTPTIVDGQLQIKCTKCGTARISITAIVGGSSVGGGDNMGGMEVTREAEIVVRHSIAENGGWL